MKRNALPHIINGYYTASSLMHAITRDFKRPSYKQQNKFSALMTTIANCCVGVTDATYYNRCAEPRQEHSMTEETIRKMMCGKPPIETVWPEVYYAIQEGRFFPMSSRAQEARVYGQLFGPLMYWLPNNNQTKHILLSSTEPYPVDNFVVVPSERDQIATANAARR
jgi:hypothetical protein